MSLRNNAIVFVLLLTKTHLGNVMKRIWLLFLAAVMMLLCLGHTHQCDATVYAYVPNYNDSNISVVNTSTNMEIATIEIEGFGVVNDKIGKMVGVAVLPDGNSVSPDRNYVYVANYGSNTVSVIDTYDMEEVDGSPIVVGENPVGVAVSPNGDYVYVANYGSNTVSVIDTSDWKEVDGSPIDVGTEPVGVAVSPSGDYVYVTCYNSADPPQQGEGELYVVDISDMDEVDVFSIVVGKRPVGVAVSPNGDYVYVACRNDDELYVVDISDMDEVDVFSIVVGKRPVGVAVSPNGDYVYVACRRDDELYVVDTDNSDGDEVRCIIPIGDKPAAFGNFIGERPIMDLAAPTNLSATAVSDTQIDLSWSYNSSDQSGFEIERKIVSKPTSSQTDSEDDVKTDSEENYAVIDTVGADSEENYTVIDTVGADERSYSDTGLEPYTTYSYRVRAYNDDGYSEYSNEAEAETRDDCFIATAAYGSLLEPHVATLRKFRDVNLLSCAPGRMFVKTYYAHSPPIADFIAKHETLRALVRVVLLPLVAFSYATLLLGLFPALAALLFFVALPVGFISFGRLVLAIPRTVNSYT